MAVLGSGDMLGDRYRLDEFVAAGGMGQVWRATDTVLGRTVAAKVLLPSLLTDPGFEARFRAEARIMAGLRHTGVVNVYDYGESTSPDGGRTLYLVMAFVEGVSLSERLTEHGRMSPAETMSVVAQAADALDAAHTTGIIHRDVKPGNLLVQDDGTVTLVDFGVARSTSVTSVTTGNAVPGTALYMAPEQAQGHPVTPATDIYALGAVAYHCLAGNPPFTGNNPIEIALQHLQDPPPPLPDDVPEGVRRLVERAMAKDPADRFPTAAAMAAAARTLAADPTAVVAAVPRVRRFDSATAEEPSPVLAAAAATAPAGAAAATGGGRRRGAVIGAVAAVIVAVGALFALWGFTKNGQPDSPTSKPTAGISAQSGAASVPGQTKAPVAQHSGSGRPSNTPSQSPSAAVTSNAAVPPTKGAGTPSPTPSKSTAPPASEPPSPSAPAGGAASTPPANGTGT
jgi:eukaryotic-like serine/threonine-protein kinase